ncbi:MAG TPA: RsmE family RNA methyltransferase [Gemmatimonadaceae bacterium]|nr:RsmE family RNA methyltransferase [Gemmatimonadaceae bacterium]
MERGDLAALGGLATFFSAEPLLPGRATALGEEEASHARVRRLDVGSAVRLVDGRGTVAHGTLVRLAKAHAVVDVAEVREAEPLPPIHLLAPVADRDRMLWLAEKATELGVSSWRPVQWHRSRSVSPRGEGMTFQGKVRARMIGALKQSGGAWLPDIHPEAPPARALLAAPAGMRLLLDVEGTPILSRDLAAPVTLALGPEGGVEPAEREALLAAGFTPVRLADSVLRFETAGVAALGVLRAALTCTPETDRA